jgi:hypothetical protein
LGFGGGGDGSRSLLDCVSFLRQFWTVTDLR